MINDICPPKNPYFIDKIFWDCKLHKPYEDEYTPLKKYPSNKEHDEKTTIFLYLKTREFLLKKYNQFIHLLYNKLYLKRALEIVHFAKGEKTSYTLIYNLFRNESLTLELIKLVLDKEFIYDKSYLRDRNILGDNNGKHLVTCNKEEKLKMILANTAIEWTADIIQELATDLSIIPKDGLEHSNFSRYYWVCELLNLQKKKNIEKDLKYLILNEKELDKIKMYSVSRGGSWGREGYNWAVFESSWISQMEGSILNDEIFDFIKNKVVYSYQTSNYFQIYELRRDYYPFWTGEYNDNVFGDFNDAISFATLIENRNPKFKVQNLLMSINCQLNLSSEFVLKNIEDFMYLGYYNTNHIDASLLITFIDKLTDSKFIDKYLKNLEKLKYIDKTYYENVKYLYNP